MCIWYFHWKGPDKMYTSCTSSESKLCNSNKTCCEAYGFGTPFGQRALCVYGQCLYKSRTLWGNCFHSTYACGTVCPYRKGLSKAVTTAKLKKTEAVFRCSGPLLAMKWCDKRAVTVLTTIHAAVHLETNKTDAQGNRILKPLAVVDYMKKMGGLWYIRSVNILLQFSVEIYKVMEEAVYPSSKYSSSECTYTKFQVWL